MEARPGRNACSGTARFDLILVSRLLCFHVNRFGKSIYALDGLGTSTMQSCIIYHNDSWSTAGERCWKTILGQDLSKFGLPVWNYLRNP